MPSAKGDSVGTQDEFAFAARWLACTLPCRRFADTLTDATARLGADVTRYIFIAVDSHHLLLAGLPALPLAKPIGRQRKPDPANAALPTER